MDIEKIRFLRESSYVDRVHTTPSHGSYPLGQHCYNMLMLAFELHPNIHLPLVEAIMYHDAAERIIGDLPHPGKRISSHLLAACKDAEERIQKKWGLEVYLSEKDKRWLKALDLLEFYLWCQDQIHMGNGNVDYKSSMTKDLLQKQSIPEEIRSFVDVFEWSRGPDQL